MSSSEATQLKETVLSGAHFDGAGVISFIDNNEQTAHNIFEIALQAMIGEKVMEPYVAGRLGLKPRWYDIHHLPSPVGNQSAENAMKWLLGNFSTADDDSVVWHYNFDVVFRGETLRAPWPSAFGQSYCILALLLWYRHSSDRKYLDLAERAIGLFANEIGNGGVLFRITGDEYFFEEIPTARPTHILNAHLIALMAIGEFIEDSGSGLAKELFEKGVAALERMMPLYDTGNWSTYDLPYEVKTLIRLSPQEDSSVYIGRVSLSESPDNVQTLEASDDGAFVGESSRLSGIDWGGVIDLEGEAGRGVIYGPAVRAEAPPTGTIQNSYVYFELPVRDNTCVNPLNLDLRVYAERETRLSVELQDLSAQTLSFYQPDERYTIHLLPGWNEVCLEIESGRLKTPLSVEYHDFHTSVLEGIYHLTKSVDIKKWRDKFYKYKTAG